MTNHSRELLLIFVSYKISKKQVDKLNTCLFNLPKNIGYAVAVNQYETGDYSEKLRSEADYFIANAKNLGYSCAINKIVSEIKELPPYIAILNVDIYWDAGTFEIILEWMKKNLEIVLAVPKILNPAGYTQKLCKRNPTILALVSRRFIPDWIKPLWIKQYDEWYVMSDYDYETVFEVPYLSGCCMVIKSNSFLNVGGFDENYFLYLEDADITRKLSFQGNCIHFPLVYVFHEWGRGNYNNIRLLIVNIISAWYYFSKWGIKLW